MCVVRRHPVAAGVRCPDVGAALRDWGVRMFIGAFVVLFISFVGSMQERTISRRSSISSRAVIFVFALLARQAGTNSVAIVAVAATLGCIVAVANGWYEVFVLGKERVAGQHQLDLFLRHGRATGFFAVGAGRDQIELALAADRRLPFGLGQRSMAGRAARCWRRRRCSQGSRCIC